MGHPVWGGRAVVARATAPGPVSMDRVAPMKRTLWIALLALVMGTNVGCETLLRRMVCRHDWGPYPGYICGHWNGGYRGRSPHLTNSWCRGCGEKYYHDGWTPWPDCHEPCDYCGNFTGNSYPGRSGGGPGSGYGCADPGILRPEPLVDGSGYMPTCAGGGCYAGDGAPGGEMMADGAAPDATMDVAAMPGVAMPGGEMAGPGYTGRGWFSRGMNPMNSGRGAWGPSGGALAGGPSLSGAMPGRAMFGGASSMAAQRGGPSQGYSASEFYPPEPGAAYVAQGDPTGGYPRGGSPGMTYGPYAPPRNPNQGGFWSQLFAGYPQQQQSAAGGSALAPHRNWGGGGPARGWSRMTPSPRESMLADGGRGRTMQVERSLPAEMSPAETAREATVPSMASRPRRTRETRSAGMPEFREQIVDEEYARTIPPEGVEVYRSPMVWRDLGPANSPEARMATRPQRERTETAPQSTGAGGTRRSSYEWAPQRTKVSRASRSDGDGASEYIARRSTRPAARLRTVE